jgi:hypothetical protein
MENSVVYLILVTVGLLFGVPLSLWLMVALTDGRISRFRNRFRKK